jgi:hypothetical protein
MHQSCTYRIEVRGQLEEKAFNKTSPLQVTVVRTDPAAAHFTTCTDQAGLVGLIRHLHGQGFLLLSLYRER